MAQWHLALAVMGTFVAIATLVFAAYKYIDGQIKAGDKALAERIAAEAKAQSAINDSLHTRITEVKDNTPTHRDLMRIEAALTQISQRIDQFFDMVVKHRGGK